MREHIRFLGKDTFVYGLAGGLSRFVKVLLVPIVVRAFPVETFGVFDAMNVYVFMLAMLGLLGLDSAVVLVARRESGAGSHRAMAGGFTLVLLFSCIVGALLAVAPRAWSVLLLGTDRYAPIVVWSAVTVPFSSLLMYLLSLLKWEFRRGWYLAASLGSAFASILFTWIVAFHTATGLVGLFAASLAGQLLGAVIAGWGCRNLIGIGWDRQLARRMLVIGLPFTMVGVVGSMMPSIDRFFLVRLHSLADAGVYGFGQKVAALSALGLAGFQAAWGPFALSMENARKKAEIFGRVFLIVLALGVHVSIVLALATPWIADILGRTEYRVAATVVGPLGLSLALGAVFFIVSTGAFLEGKTLRTLFAYLAGVLTAIGMNLLLGSLQTTPEAIAWANCLGQAVAVAWMARLSHRVHPVPYPLVRGAVLLVLGAGAAAWAGRVGGHLSGAEAVGAALAVTAAIAAWGWFVMLGTAERRALQRRPIRP